MPDVPRSPQPFRTLRNRVRARRTFRTLRTLAAAAAAGAVAVGFERLTDRAAGLHAALAKTAPAWALAVLPLGLVLAAWVARRFAPFASGGGIAQVVAAAEDPAPPRPDRRVSLRTAGAGALLCIVLFACGASIGPEGPTIQLAAAMAALFAGAHGTGRRPLFAAAGGAGLAAAFNTPFAGVVFAVEELAGGSLAPRSARVVMLAVAGAAAASWGLIGDYVYFGSLRTEALASAWLAAPVAGAVAGLAGGLFARALKRLVGPRPGALGRWRARRPFLFSLVCAAVATTVAALSGGLTYGPGSPETRALLAGAPGHGLIYAALKWLATLAAAASGGPGGILAPMLATGAGVGAALADVFPFAARSDVVVLSMAACFAGVAQAPFTSAVLVMELNRDPGMAGPLIVAGLVGQFVSARVSGAPLYHVLAETWLRKAPR